MNKIIGYEYTYLLNDTYYLTIALEGEEKEFANYAKINSIFDLNIKSILKNKYIYVNKTHYEFDYNNFPILSKIITKTQLYHIQPRVSKRILKSKYYFDTVGKENFKMDKEEENTILFNNL